MSFYKPNDFSFTDHGLQRARERISILKDKDEWEARDVIRDLIRNSTHFFESRVDIYISVGKSKTLYFVFNKKNRLLITVTPVSAEKQFRLSSWDGY